MKHLSRQEVPSKLKKIDHMIYTESGKIARKEMKINLLMESYKMKQPVIIAAKRIAFGKYGGRLRHLEPESLLEPLFNHFTDQYPKVMSLWMTSF